jgi:hypothetical protein
MRKGPGSVYDKWNISKGYSGQKRKIFRTEVVIRGRALTHHLVGFVLLILQYSVQYCVAHWSSFYDFTYGHCIVRFSAKYVALKE